MSTIFNDSQSTYRVFISFTSADQALAEYLANGLRRILDGFDFVYCFSQPGRYNSKAGSRPSDNFMKVIDDGLKRSNVFLLLWSTHARDSNWVREEFDQARHFHVNKVKRLGREFKIVPVKIDGCGLPMSMHDIVHVTYSSGDDFQGVLNQVLSALGILAETDSLEVRIMKEKIFELKTAFRNREWATVTQQYPALLQIYPQALSSTTHYMYAIALVRQGKSMQAQTVVYEGLALENRGEDAELLDTYVQYLKERELWREILLVAEKAMPMFPHDAYWPRLRMEVLSKAVPPSSMSYQSQPHVQPYQNLDAGVNTTGTSINGPTLPFTNQNYSNSYFQQPPPLSQTSGFPNPHNSSPITGLHPLRPLDPITEEFGVPPNDLSHVTRKLSEEDFPPETEDDFWPKANSFTERHLSHQKLRKLLNFPFVAAAFLNSLCFLLISFVWPFTQRFMWIEALTMLFILGLGKMVEAAITKLLCITLLCIIWAASGYCLGYWAINWFGWKTGTSLTDWIELVCTIGVVIIGISGHLRLFHSDQ